eukprot:m51a1_g13260 putative dj-1 family protein (187) ;mRNA; f:1587-2398
MSEANSKRVLLVVVVDVLRRAKASVVVASVEATRQITLARGVVVVADRLVAEAAGDAWDLVVVPGGMPGATTLRDSEALRGILQRQKEQGRPYAAICAAPAVVLATHGLLEGRRCTAYPAFQDKLRGGVAVEERVVVDKAGGSASTVVTSRGPGTALEFAVELVRLLYGDQAAADVARPMLPNFSF